MCNLSQGVREDGRREGYAECEAELITKMYKNCLSKNRIYKVAKHKAVIWENQELWEVLVMKRAVCTFICILFVLCLTACGKNNMKVKTPKVSSEKYSQKEISAAIDVIKDEFEREWQGCTLQEIYYAGDEMSADYQDWANRNNADEVIVLLSTFDVDDSCTDGSLNKNCTYSDWMWILVRTNGGKWQHVDHGY